MNNSNLENAYISALELASSHYENFPVVSFLIPKYLRKHVAIVYQFARQADDLADEGEFSVEVRLSKLDQYEADFKKCLQIYDTGFSEDPFPYPGSIQKMDREGYRIY